MVNIDPGVNSLRSCLKASQIRNIEGKILDRDGNPMKPVRRVIIYDKESIPNDSGTTKSTNQVGAANDVVGSKTMDSIASKNDPNGKSGLIHYFASVVQQKSAKHVVKVKELRNSEKVDGAAVAIPIEAVVEVSSRFDNTPYGYFIGDRLVFPLVEKYVKNTWAKYGLKRIQLHEEFFLFQFDTKEGFKEDVELTPAEAFKADCDIKANKHHSPRPSNLKSMLLKESRYNEYTEVPTYFCYSNDMNTSTRSIEQFSSNTKFLRHSSDEWSKFVTDVKLVKDLHTTNVDQLHAYLQQHERHANEVRLMHERNSDPLALVASHHLVTPYQNQQFTTNQSTPLSITYPSNEYQSSVHHNVYSPQSSIPQLEYAPTTYQHQQSEFSQPDSGLIVPVFQKGDDPINAINHMMSFLTAVVTSRYPTTNNQLRTSSNPQKSTKKQATSYDGKREGHIAKQCTKPKRKRDETWFNDKVLLTVITYNAAYQANDLDAYDFDVMTQLKPKIAPSWRIFPRNGSDATHETNSVLDQNAPSFTQLFELSELRAQSQAKDTVIVKLKEQIKSLKGNVDDSKVKMDMDEIETLNIELEHREQGLVIAALKNELRKLKGKALDKEAIETHSVDPKVSKDNMEPITPKLLNKRTAHASYIKHTQEEALVLKDIVEHVKANYPQDSLLESAFRYTKVIQDLLSHISRTCPSINNFDPQLVAITPRKKDKKVRFAESLTSTENTKTDSTSNIVSNKRVLHSTGVRLSTSASGSQPSGNTRNDRIQQTPSSNSKNKVEDHPRNVKSSLNKRNSDTDSYTSG
ncbi:hypothetical protein Tco_0451642 [Tanacetum coccineum]